MSSNPVLLLGNLKLQRPEIKEKQPMPATSPGEK